MTDFQKFYYPMPGPRLHLPPRIDAEAIVRATLKHHADEAVRMFGANQRNFKRGQKSKERCFKRLARLLRLAAQNTYQHLYWTQQVPRDQQRFRLASLRHYRPQTMASIFDAVVWVTEASRERQRKMDALVDGMVELAGKVPETPDVERP